MLDVRHKYTRETKMDFVEKVVDQIFELSTTDDGAIDTNNPIKVAENIFMKIIIQSERGGAFPDD